MLRNGAIGADQRELTHMKRFELVIVDKSYIYIRDNQAKDFNMPEHAVSLNFGVHAMGRMRATAVCYDLNEEWQDFLNNPS